MLGLLKKALSKKKTPSKAQTTLHSKETPLIPSEVFTDEIRELYKQGEYTISTDSIYKFVGSKLFLKLEEQLSKNQIALLNIFEQIMLVHLTYLMKAKNVLEIGTYKGGTSFNIAAALNEAQSGTLTTIDPFEYHNKAINNISRFPAEIRDRISQKEQSSADYFNDLTYNKVEFDLMFIDGNHNYEFAYFDTLCSANFIKPGGLLVFDNIDQCGPRFAVQKFLRENPDWTDLLGGVARPIPENSSPLEYFNGGIRDFITANGKNLAPDCSFYILQAPQCYSIKQLPMTIGPEYVDLKLAMSPKFITFKSENSIQGKLYVLAYLRIFYPNKTPVEMKTSQIININTNQQTEYQIPLDCKEITPSLLEGSQSFTVEISFSFWENSGQEQALVLTEKPRVECYSVSPV